MAWIIGESFDPYNGVSDISAGGLWDVVNAAGLSSLPAGRVTGKSLSFNTVAYPTLTKSSVSNDSGHHIVCAYKIVTPYPSGAGRGLQFTLLDGTNSQCTFMLDAFNGNVLFYSGGSSGSLIGTFSSANLANGAWWGIEVEAVIHNTLGSMKLRLNGNTTEDFTLTNVNTRAGSTNAYANKLQIGISAGLTGAGAVILDDLLWFSTSGAAPNTWVGDIRCETKYPLTLATGNLSGSPVAPITQTPPGNVTTTSWTGPRIITSDLITLTTGGTISSVSVINGTGAYTGKFKVGVYDGTSGTPGALLAQSAEQTNIATNTTVTIALISPITGTIGQKIFTAMILDSAISNLSVVIASTSGYSVQNSTAYSAGFPSNLGNPTLGNTSPANLPVVFSVVDNATYVSQIAEDADATFTYSATAGQNDFYNIQSLSSTPASIIGVQTRLMSRKSDTGARQARVQIKSGATTSNGSTITMGTSYTYTNKVDVLDPNTGAAWAASAVNNLQVGAYVVA